MPAKSCVVGWELARGTAAGVVAVAVVVGGGVVIWLMSGSVHCRGIVVHEGRHVYCVLGVLRAVPPLPPAPPSSSSSVM